MNASYADTSFRLSSQNLTTPCVTKTTSVKLQAKPVAGACRYLARRLMRYFDVNGKELPCPFIKDTRDFPGADTTRQKMAMGGVPEVCEGCSEIPRLPMNRILFA